MSKLSFLIRKELLLISKDIHGLLLLFLMPSLFILIMSFALQNQYADTKNVSLDFFLINHDINQGSKDLAIALNNIQGLHRLQSAESENQLVQRVAKDKASFLLVIPSGFTEKLGKEPVLQIYTSPSTTAVTSQLIKAQIAQQVFRQHANSNLAEMISADQLESLLNPDHFVTDRSTFHDQKKTPSSVQQNVPAWLLFAMFFIAIPLSTTVIAERQQGTLARLKTMGVSQISMLSGKLIPYLFINLLQVIAMLFLGIYLMPLLGGESLGKNFSCSGLLLISACASLAAVSFGLLIAQLARTIEQATIIAGVSNILMAALGGVMVPRFIMPPSLRTLSEISPMAWGLEGFLDIFLRQGNAADVGPESVKLLLFAAALLIFSVLAGSRKESAL